MRQKKAHDRQRIRFEKYKSWKAQSLINNQPIKGLWFRKAIHPLIRCGLFLQRRINKFEIEFVNRDLEDTEKTRVFAVSHIGKWDYEIINEVLQPHSYIIAADFMHMYGRIAGFLLNLNGVIYVDETDKKDRINSKRMMEKVLNSGNNMMIFPEGTWNLSDNEIIYDLPFGCAEIAINTNSVITPICMEQYEERFVINVGKNIIPTDKEITTQCLRDVMATLKYEIWEREGIGCRNEIPWNYWDCFIQKRISEWYGYAISEQRINIFLPNKKKEYYEILKDMRNLHITQDNCFMVMEIRRFLEYANGSCIDL